MRVPDNCQAVCLTVARNAFSGDRLGRPQYQQNLLPGLHSVTAMSSGQGEPAQRLPSGSGYIAPVGLMQLKLRTWIKFVTAAQDRQAN